MTSESSIGFRAFDYCHALTGITIPASVGQIGDGAFTDNGDEFCLYVEEGGVAEQYAEENGVKCNEIK